MFSTCSTFIQNQAVLPLSCILSQYSNIRGHRPKPKHHQHKRALGKCDNPSEILCPESLTETVQQLKENDLKKLCQFVTPKALKQVALYGPNMLVSQLFSVPPRQYQSTPFSILKEKKGWIESHISHDSFLENKNHGGTFPRAFQEPRVAHLFRITQNLLKSQNDLCTNYVPHRGFKTKQSLEREALRQGSVAAILKDGLKQQRTIPEKNLKIKEAEQNPRLKNLMSEETTEEARQSMKVAFAEGYLAADPKKQDSRVLKWLKNFQMILIIVLFIALLYGLISAAGSTVFRLNVGGNNEVHPEDISVCFEDVKGVEEAKQELQEIVEFLRNPEKFTTLGAELPKGVLLVGPPGTGKTLLARAVAGEAGVPFFHAAGPEFDEILVGQGARRVRDLFRAAKIRAPCVVFIDEIDSVGAKRSNSVLHPYANQTINQLLAQMDGFHKNEGVIVLGATNRRDDLDKALLRPGRFDVEVRVSMPDLAAREELFEYYLGKLKVASDVDQSVLSRCTIGFTGADIKNLTNQAALRAAVDQVDAVSMKHLESARDKVLMGPEKKSRIPDEEANLITAYHEGGHTLVSFFTKYSHPVHKVTIIPRGPSLGHTASIPAKERYHHKKSEMLAELDVLMGGRAAEELIYGADLITSGASSDLKVATNIATYMVKELGMSESVGLRTFEEKSSQVIGNVDYLGHTTKEAIDMEIKKLLSDSYDRAKVILKTHSKELKALAEALMKYETLDAEDVKAILSGQNVPK